jgi:hypothetical protein
MLRLDRREIDEFDRSMPDLGWAIARQVVHYLNDVLAKTSRVAFHPVRTRGAYHFLRLQLSFGQSGVARGLVAHALVPQRDNGLVSVGPHGVTAIDPARLQHVAAGRGGALFLDTLRFPTKLLPP